MRKYLFIILILVFVSGVYGQEFKLIAGPIISNYSDGWPNGFLPLPIFAGNANLNLFKNNKTGLLAGFGIEFALNKNIALELDGLYFHKGSSFVQHTMIFTSYKEVYNLSGLNFPMLVKIKFLPRPFPYLLGGGEFSLILSHTRINFFRGEAELRYREISRDDLIDATKKVDFGPVFGLGFEIKISKGVLFFEGRYNLGLRNLLNWYDIQEPKIKTCSLVIITGFKFS